MDVFDHLEDVLQRLRGLNRYSQAIANLLTLEGALMVLILLSKLILSLFQGFRLYVFHQICSKRRFKKKYGVWAVISGSTDGIGLAMAKELARDGHSIVVMGRNEEKLVRTKTILEAEVNVGEVLTVKIDLSDQSLDNYERVRRKIDPDNRDIGVLINNAGTISETLKRYHNFDLAAIQSTINVNVVATLYLTRLIMPGMIQRGRGLVVNVSSIISSIPGPYLGAYGPSKTFIDSFSKALQVEYSSYPIDIVNLIPFKVHTNLLKRTSNLERPSLMNPTPEEYARKSLNAISSGSPEIAGTAFHALSLAAAKLLDSWGLIPALTRLSFSNNSRRHCISPKPKRKKPAKTDGTNQTQ